MATVLLVTIPALASLANLPQPLADAPEQGVRVILGLCAQGDWVRPESCLGLPLKDSFKASHLGLPLVSLGKPTWEAHFPGMVVPFAIRLKSGLVRRGEMAFLQHPTTGKWTCASGL